MKTTIEAITELLFVEDSLPEKADLIFVMGGRQASLMDPAISAYRAGLCAKILVSGSSSAQFATLQKSECEELTEYAIANGVSEGSLITESRSTNTLENVVFSKRRIEDVFGWENIRSVIVCCKGFHSRRVLMTMQKNWPDHVEIYFQTVPGERQGIRKEDWWLQEQSRTRVLEEVERIAKYSLKGDIDGL